MKNWYVLIDELTHEQECELVQLMFGVSGRLFEWYGDEEALGSWDGDINYWWDSRGLVTNCEKLSYKQAVKLLEEELSDEC